MHSVQKLSAVVATSLLLLLSLPTQPVTLFTLLILSIYVCGTLFIALRESIIPRSPSNCYPAEAKEPQHWQHEMLLPHSVRHPRVRRIHEHIEVNLPTFDDVVKYLINFTQLSSQCLVSSPVKEVPSLMRKLHRVPVS